MARPQSADYEERKKKILSTASNLFAKNGYHKAAISQVAISCNMSKSLIYHYYDSKQEVLYHAMLEHVQELEKLANDIMQENLEPEITLRKIIRQYLYIYEGSVAQHHLLINELESLTATQKSKIIRIQNNVVKAFADIAETLAPASLSKHNARTAISMLLLGMLNWTYIWFKPEGQIKTDQLSEIIACMFISGLTGLHDDVFTKTS